MYNLLSISGGAIVDIVALLFLLGFALHGLIKGFAKSFVSLFGTVISLLLAVLLCSLVARFLESEFSLVTNISGSISNTLNNIFGETIMNTTLEQATEEILKDAGLGGIILTIVIAFKGDIGIPTDVTLNQVLSPTFSYYIVMLISALILFILFKVLLFLLGEIIKNTRSNFVRKTDKTLGLLLGLLSGVIYIEFFIMIISVIPLGFCQDLYSYILSSTFTNFINNLNLFNKMLSAISINDIVTLVKTAIN